MQNFFFHNQTKIIFGKGSVDQVGRELKNYGSRALLVYGRQSIKQSGLYERVKTLLSNENIETFELDGIRPNPLLSDVRRGIDIAHENQAGVLLAVGGGSVIDTAKAIAAGALASHDVWDFFTRKAKLTQALPVVTIQTIAATGSEMNGGSVITNTETKQKLPIGGACLYPKVSILDPALTFTVPPQYTAYGAVDAISHVLEGYFNGADESPLLQDQLMEGILRTIIEVTPRVLKSPENYEYRAVLMWSATVAFNGITMAGLGKVKYFIHTIAHALGVLFDISHGAAVSVIIPGWMKDTVEERPRKFIQFARQVLRIGNGSEHEVAVEGVMSFKKWLSSIGSPVSLGEVGIKASDIKEITANALIYAQRDGLADFNEKRISQVLNQCL